MKKIGIISDTHGLLRPEILGILKGCDCIIHAGDVNKPEILDTLRMMGSIYVVRGNNDKDWAEGMAKTYLPGLDIRCIAQRCVKSFGTSRQVVHGCRQLVS